MTAYTWADPHVMICSSRKSDKCSQSACGTTEAIANVQKKALGSPLTMVCGRVVYDASDSAAR